MSIRTATALVVMLAGVAAGLAATGHAGTGRPASAIAEAYARQDPSGVRVDYVNVDGDGNTKGDNTHVAASTRGGHGTASASAVVKAVDIFDGLVTADVVRVEADAGGDGTSTSGSVTALTINGTAVRAPTGRTTYDLGGYGRLVALGSGSSGILGLRAHLDKPYKTHSAGEIVRVAYASARAADAVRAAAAPQSGPSTRKSAHKARKHKAKRRGPLTALEKIQAGVRNRRDRRWKRQLLAAPGYAFPVAGAHNFTDTFGAARSDVPVHIGNDVFAPFGTPILAVADGRLYRVGTLKISGNRLWLRDRRGYRYFYCHLSDFAAAAFNGADVHAGEVIGFVGNTGDAEPTPPHLHFEVHMPDDKVVDPYPYLHKWDLSGVSSASWIRRYGKDPGVRPGALVVVKDFLAEP
ncbi:MAG: choice-of-anchor P family protein [Thermoleophilaceae bacterium]